MPVKPCQTNGKPGYKWGDKGKCYPYTPGDRKSQTEARLRAETQGRAIESSKHKEEK